MRVLKEWFCQDTLVRLLLYDIPSFVLRDKTFTFYLTSSGLRQVKGV